MIRCGLDRLLGQSERLEGRRYGLLCHQASLTADCEPAHLALLRYRAPPAVLFAPEHGFYGVEQDMVVARERRDPVSGLPIVSLYGDDIASLRPRPEAFEGLDLLVVDLQDVGARYYTFAATAVWAAEAAIGRGCEVWVLDRPNPLGGIEVSGGGVDRELRSFVGAFDMPIRHGLTLAEIVLLEAQRRRWSEGAVTCFPVEGWRRGDDATAWGTPWVAPSPNMPAAVTAFLYPGLCLVEGTEVSEGRGTTRPFQLVGAPWVEPARLRRELDRLDLEGVRCVPTFFRPQFQKHAGEVCGGVELVVTEPSRLDAVRLGAELVAALRRLYPDHFRWRERAYEFVEDIPAIDLLTGSSAYRETVEGGAPVSAWLKSLRGRDEAFREERRSVLLYPEAP
ncbi:MAG TPA: DUF1343 domain-containing protein [Thermoanaerobaculia bacterium]|nr:DUF1343 domain-containing protein [Thermoanaerobaculia bacterium]